MLGTSARLLRLLTLLQSRRAWTGGELCARLEITARTLRRDVDRLRSLGYPVHSTSGVAGGYRFGAGAELPPLLLDDEEALAVSLGLRTAAAGGVAGLEEVALRALTKLEQVLPARLRRRLSALHASIVPLARGGPTVDARVLAALAAACRDTLRLTFGYSAKEGARTDRRVEPAGLVHTGWRWYLVAWDLARDDWRTFRVDRIAEPVTAGAAFFPRSPPEGGLAAYVARSVSLTPYPVRARVLLHAPIEEMARKVPPSSGSLESVGARSCLLHAGAPSLDALAVWMSLLGVEFEVRDPPEARAHLRKMGERALRAAGVRVPARAR
ncbi:MAG TPA: YafY family protein [Polyangia bacterium]|nr:YafY family protein [Polyangia bacterium]